MLFLGLFCVVLNFKFNVLFLPISRVIAISVTEIEISKRAGAGRRLGSRVEHFGDVESFCFTIEEGRLEHI